jgi:hypothetical protein
LGHRTLPLSALELVTVMVGTAVILLMRRSDYHGFVLKEKL